MTTKTKTRTPVTNPIVIKLRDAFFVLRRQHTLACGDEAPVIRFTFSERETHALFSIKFSNTHKLITFKVSNDPEGTSFECSFNEKTMNIVDDIDTIYKQQRVEQFGPATIREVMAFNTNTPVPAFIALIFQHGITKNPDRINEIHKAHAVCLKGQDRYSLKRDVLYFDVIVAAEVEEVECLDPDKVCVNITTLNSGQFLIAMTRRYAQSELVDRLFVLNHLQRYNVMDFSTAKKHLLFKAEEFYYVVNYLQEKESQHAQVPTHQETGSQEACSQNPEAVAEQIPKGGFKLGQLWSFFAGKKEGSGFPKTQVG